MTPDCHGWLSISFPDMLGVVGNRGGRLGPSVIMGGAVEGCGCEWRLGLARQGDLSVDVTWEAR